ncbi:hypothetical protein MASR2M41_13860 [Flammeovirgaceae bacterium]
MTLKNLLKLFADNNCEKLYVKRLVRNNTSKQQVYVASGDTSVLNVFPLDDFQSVSNDIAKGATFHARCNFFWIDNEGIKYHAPHAKFILYPKYPEVRFSGFLKGCKKAPSEILNNPVDGRYIFFGVNNADQIIGYAADADSAVANEFEKIEGLPTVGVLQYMTVQKSRLVTDTKRILIDTLKSVHAKGWIESKQLKPGFVLEPCFGTRCGGLTLEAELNIIQNGKSEPDFLGWEIKQFGVKKFHLLNSARVTLMTPEPDSGFYNSAGVIDFVKRFGYASKKTEYRMDFTGTHRCNVEHNKTKLTMKVSGFDFEKQTMINPDGGLFLLDGKDNVAAGWSFAKMLSHWNKKHAQASYIPSLLRVNDSKREYCFSNQIMLGEGTNFNFFLNAFEKGFICYDPGIKIEDMNQRDTPKARSQFRISSKHISSLYQKFEMIDINKF